MVKWILTLTVVLFAATGFAKNYQGAAWVDDDCYRYNGSSWDTCTKNRYTGAAWEEIETSGGGTTPTMLLEGTEGDGDSLTIGSGTVTYNGSITSETNHLGTPSAAFGVNHTLNEWLTIDSANNMDYSEGKLDFWYTPTTVLGTDERVFLGDGVDYHYFMFGTADTQFHFRGQSTRTHTYFAVDPHGMVVGTWYHITFSWSLTSGDLVFTIDGGSFNNVTSTASGVFTSAGTMASTMLIGKASSGYGILGNIDTITIYDTATP